MAIVADVVEKRITREATGVASSMLNKLKKNTKNNNVSTISFPSNLENQAQSTYMVIYIFENISNKQKFSNTVFNASEGEETYEIGAITWLKDKLNKEVIDPLTKEVKNLGKDLVKSGTDWLKKAEKAAGEATTKAVNDTAKSIGIKTDVMKEIKDFTSDYIIPKRKKSESKALKDFLDPTKNMANGYRLEKAIQIQMPSSSLTYKYENGWESADTSTLNTIRTLVSGIKGLFGNKEQRKDAKSDLSNVFNKIIDKVGDAFTGSGYMATEMAQKRYVYNPVLVFNYTIPTPRTFSYSFSLYPRNKEELYTLFNLIQTLKFYALPEVRESVKNGAVSTAMTYNYPAKFAIKFYTNGYENSWFPKTLTLGLTSIEETLTGDNGDMAFFENYFDKNSGNPPRMVNLTLSFKELGIMSRNAANRGY